MANTHSLDLEASSSQYASIADASQTGLDLTGDFTIEFGLKWESFNSNGNEIGLVTKQNADGAGGYQIALYNNAGTYELEAKIGSDSGTTTRDIYKWVITPGTTDWHHYAITCDISEPSATTFEFFLDTVSQGNGTAVVAGNCSSIYNNDKALYIGCRYNASAGSFYDGLIDEVRIWNDIRTGAEITTNYLTELVGDEAGLVGYWDWDGEVYTDKTSNNNDLTASGSPVFSTDVPFTGGSASASVSASVSPSASLSPSGSMSPSRSASSSASKSLSPSGSTSSSMSASPSSGYTAYTKGNYAVLPSDDTDLENTYTAGEVTDVSTSNNVWVDQTALGETSIHQYKDFIGSNSNAVLTWEGKSSLAPSSSTVYLQVYNQNTTAWETVDSNSTASADTNFYLSATISNTTNYKDGSNIVSSRIYQEAI